MSRNVWGVVALFSLIISASAAQPTGTIKIESTTALAGQDDVLVRLLVDNSDPVLGMSFAGTYDDGLTFDRLSVEGTEFGPGKLDADFVKQMKWDKVFGAAIVIELPGSIQDPYNKLTLATGTNQYAVALYFDVDGGLPGGTVLDIDLRDDLLSCDPSDAVNCNPDPPAVSPVMTVEGVTVTPGLQDGTITIVGAPDIQSIDPALGPIGGGTDVTIKGVRFTSDTAVTIGGLALGSKAFVDAQTITGKTPAHAAGAADVVVSNTIGNDTLPGGFTYVGAPTIATVTPNQGSGNVTVTITGTNFTTNTDTVVLFGSSQATNVQVQSTSQLTCSLPACGVAQQAQWVSITVTTVAGSDTLEQGYFCEGTQVENFRRGDSNRDGSMNIADAVYILQNLFAQGPKILCPDAADANDDEGVNIADAVYILQRLFAQGPAIPAPSPGCGPDPTPHPTGGANLAACDYCAEACQTPPTACQ